MTNEQKVIFYDKLKRAIENYNPNEKITIEFDNMAVKLEIVDMQRRDPADINIHVKDEIKATDKFGG
jgi:TusA-related sulfurtransferase